MVHPLTRSYLTNLDVCQEPRSVGRLRRVFSMSRGTAPDIGWLEDVDSVLRFPNPPSSSLPVSTSATSVLETVLKESAPVVVKKPINASGNSKSTSADGPSTPPPSPIQRKRACVQHLVVPLSWAEHYAEVLADIAGNAVGHLYAQMAAGSRNGKRAAPHDWEEADRQWRATQRATK